MTPGGDETQRIRRVFLTRNSIIMSYVQEIPRGVGCMVAALFSSEQCDYTSTETDLRSRWVDDCKTVQLFASQPVQHRNEASETDLFFKKKASPGLVS